MVRDNRNVSVELLRIIAMLLIIFGHAITHGRVLRATEGINHFWAETLNILDTPATNIYVLISAFFLVENRFKPKRLFLIWGQTLFFSVGCYLVLCFCNAAPFAPMRLMKALLPISGDQYWFVRCYVGMYLFSPFMGMFLRSLTHRQYLAFLTLMLGAFSLWSSLLPFAHTWNTEGGNGLFWFMTLFAVGGYLRLHVRNYPCPANSALLMAISALLAIGLYFLVKAISFKAGFHGKGTWIVSSFTSLPILLLSLTPLIWALSCNGSVPYRKIVTFLSSSTFSVYLIHENPYVRPLLWNRLAPWHYASSPWLIPICLGMTVCIFLICVIIHVMTWRWLQSLFFLNNIRKSNEHSV